MAAVTARVEPESGRTGLRVAQLVLGSAGLYERKMQRLDAAALDSHVTVETWRERGGRYESGSEAATPRELWRSLEQRKIDLVHVYGPPRLSGPLWKTVPIPYVASGTPPPARWLWGRPGVAPARSTSPLDRDGAPEAVGGEWFARDAEGRIATPPCRIGVFARPGTREILDGAEHRMLRFREDCTFVRFAAPPEPEDLRTVDLWIDPVESEADFDGFTAEALVCGLPVVASRTAINHLRLAGGARGFLVPPRDPNELVHAILTALFKPEIAGPKQLRAAADRDSFRPERRAGHLLRLYEAAR